MGITFRKNVYYMPGGVAADLTGATAFLRVRTTIASVTDLVNLTTENGGITLTEAEGKLALFIDETETAALDYADFPAIYELVLTLGDDTIWLLEGTASFKRRFPDV